MQQQQQTPNIPILSLKDARKQVKLKYRAQLLRGAENSLRQFIEAVALVSELDPTMSRDSEQDAISTCVEGLGEVLKYAIRQQEKDEDEFNEQARRAFEQRLQDQEHNV